MDTNDENNFLPLRERPFKVGTAPHLVYEYVRHKTLDDVRSDKDVIVIFEGDYGSQTYLTCPVSQVRCSHESLRTLLDEMGRFAWRDGENLYFVRVRPAGFVTGGMGGGHAVEGGLWIDGDFRNLLETGVDILEDVTDVIEGRVASVLPGAVARLVTYLETLDISQAKQGDHNFGKVADIAEALIYIGPAAAIALPVLRRLEATGIFGGGRWSRFPLRDRIREIEEQLEKESPS